VGRRNSQQNRAVLTRETGYLTLKPGWLPPATTRLQEDTYVGVTRR
jgi:hypothetical protein